MTLGAGNWSKMFWPKYERQSRWQTTKIIYETVLLRFVRFDHLYHPLVGCVSFFVGLCYFPLFDHSLGFIMSHTLHLSMQQCHYCLALNFFCSLSPCEQVWNCVSFSFVLLPTYGEQGKRISPPLEHGFPFEARVLKFTSYCFFACVIQSTMCFIFHASLTNFG